MWLNAGFAREAALAVVLKIGRPSASDPVGLIRLTSLTTGSWVPFAYITLIDPVKSWPITRSICAFDCHVYATWKPGFTAHGDCCAIVPLVTPPGNAGAPAAVPLNVYTGARGEP